jgi:hypothetical protein
MNLTESNYISIYTPFWLFCYFLNCKLILQMQHNGNDRGGMRLHSLFIWLKYGFRTASWLAKAGEIFYSLGAR